MARRTQVNSSTLIMGVTGSGKSSLIATLAKYVWKEYGKVTLLYTSDGGGYPALVEECIALGIIWVFRMLTRDPYDTGLSFETCQRACQGWWPKEIDPATGEVAPGVEMVAPVTITYDMICTNGHVAKTVYAQSQLTAVTCPTCKVQVTPANMTVKRLARPTPGFEKVGAVAFDGLTSMLAWEMRDLGHRAGRMELKGEESALGGKVTSGDLKFGGTTRSHVGFVQARGEELVHLALGIPNLVVPPVFTALTHEDVDDRQLSIRGPKISGRAKTDEAPQWVGNCLETAVVPNIAGGVGDQRILYIDEFTENGVRHLCKNRGPFGLMPAYLIDPPMDKDHPELAYTGFNLGTFFSMLGTALDSRIEAAKLDMPDAPGLPEGKRTMGVGPITGPAIEMPMPAKSATPVAQAPRAAAPAGAPVAQAAAGAPVTAVAASTAPAAVAPVAPQIKASAPRGKAKAATPASAAPAAPPAVTPAPPDAPAPDAPAPVAVVEPAADQAVVASPSVPTPVAAQAPAVAAPAAPAPAAPMPAAPKPVAVAAVARPAGAPATPVHGPTLAGRPIAAPPAGARPIAAIARPPAGAPRPPSAAPLAAPPASPADE